MQWQSVVQVVCSRDVKIAGLLGSAAAASMDAKSSAVAEQQTGLGGTTKWKLASLVCCSPAPTAHVGFAHAISRQCLSILQAVVVLIRQM